MDNVKCVNLGFTELVNIFLGVQIMLSLPLPPSVFKLPKTQRVFKKKKTLACTLDSTVNLLLTIFALINELHYYLTLHI